jgi:hypothetical protein
VAGTALAIEGYPRAKDALISWGRSAKEVEAMPVAQVVMIYTMRTYGQLRDDVFKWMAVPYPAAREGLAKAERQVAQSREVVPLARMLLPAVGSASAAGARSERTLAALRVIEAIRLHASATGGALPERLTDISVVPVPDDPVTGKPFEYRRVGATALLQSPDPRTGSGPNGLRYQIEIATKGK